jgi:predicted ribosomally synthesized peptide with SipW-like signal peptide
MNKKKIIISLSIIAAVGAIGVSATMSFFNDQEISAGNIFTAGSLDLKIDQTKQTYNDANCDTCTVWGSKDLGTDDMFFNFTDIKPGDHGTNVISILPVDNDAWLCFDIKNKQDDDNDLTEPESLVDTTAGAGEGELSGFLSSFFWWDTDQDGEFDLGETQIDNGDLKTVETLALADAGHLPQLTGGQTKYLGLAWCAGSWTATPSAGAPFSCDGSGMGNIAQSDSFKADLEFYTEQYRNNLNFTCPNQPSEEQPPVYTAPTLAISTSSGSPEGEQTGGTDTELAKFDFTADNLEDIQLEDLKIKDSGVNSDCLQNIRLFDGTTQLVSLAAFSGGEAEFPDIHFVIPRTTTRTITVKADTTSCTASCNTHKIEITDNTFVSALGKATASTATITGLPAVGNEIKLGCSEICGDGLDNDGDQLVDEDCVDHLIISEVLYNPVGTEPDGEWVEIYNPTSSTIDLSNYKIGDEETKGMGEGMYQFPAGTSILPGHFLVIADKSSIFQTAYGFKPNFEFNATDPLTPDMSHYLAWGAGLVGFGNTNDESLVLDGNDNVVDIVIWGSASPGYPGVLPHAAVSEGHSLERSPIAQDTNNCQVDFVNRFPPTPGS